jgi:hypothetical protein
MRFEFSRLRRGDIISAVGGLVLFISLFLPWYGVDTDATELCGAGNDSCSAYDTFKLFTVAILPGLDLLLTAAAVAPFILVWIIVRGHELSWPPGEVTAIVGITATALILYNGIVDRAGEDPSLISLKYGWFVALAGALMILLGAATVMMTRGGAVRRPPGTFR